jgi:hypothetical protein
MITSLDSILAIGSPWPPEDADEVARQKDLEKGELLYNDEHASKTLFPRVFEYLKDAAEDKKKCQIILSMPRQATDAHKRLLFGEAPVITPDEGKPGEATITTLLEDGLLATGKEAFIDLVRYGTCVFQVGDGPEIIATNPRHWIPIMGRGNKRKIASHLVYDIFEDVREINGQKSTVQCLNVTIHEPGFVTHRIFDLKTSSWSGGYGSISVEWDSKDVAAFLGVELDSQGRQDTGQDEPLCIVACNAMTSERWYGRSGYGEDVHRDLETLELASMRLQATLAKFCEPTVQGDDSTFEVDHSAEGRGRLVFHPDHAHGIPPQGTPLSALTWEVNSAAQEAQIERLFHHILDSLGVSIDLMAGREPGGVLSGTALRMRLIPVLSVVGEYQGLMDVAMRRAVSLACKRAGEDLEARDVAITWHDGIPMDPKETSEIIRNLDQAGAISTKRKAELQEVADVEEEVALIETDTERAGMRMI